MLHGSRVIFTLDLQRRGLTTAREADRASARGVVADLTDRPDRIVEREVAERDTGLDHLQDERCRPDFEERRHLRHVGVADDDVQSSVLLGIGVRFVAGVDDGAGAGRRGRHTLPDVLRALGEAERRRLRRGENLSGAADQLSCDQERQQDVGDPRELARPDHEIVLVTPVGVARRVGVVLEQVDVAADALVGEALFGVDEKVLEHQLSRAIVVDELDETVALGSRVLRMRPYVEVEPRSVLEEHIR